MKKTLSMLGGAIVIILAVVFLWGKAPQSIPSFGAITSPEISDNHISVNGVTTWTLKTAMNTASTTLCSFPNPAGAATSTTSTGGVINQTGLATSSLVGVSVQITTGTSTDMTFDVSTSTTPWATSSPAFVVGVPVLSGNLYSGSYMISTLGQATSTNTKLTSSMSVDNNLVGPAQFVNVKTAGAGLGGYTYTGQCMAIFRSLNSF